MSERQKSFLVYGGLILLTLFLTRDVVFRGGAYYERDIISLYSTTAQAFVRAIGEGAWPVRDPTSAFGQPLLGNPDAQVPYPPHWVNLLVLPERAYIFEAVFHFILGSAGAAAVAFRLSGSSTAGFFAGAFWLAGGPFQSFLNVWHHFASAAWMPWVLLAFDRVLERPDRRRVFELGALFGLQILAGSADMCAMTLLLALLLLICSARGAGRQNLVRFGAALGALTLATAMGSATWMTVAEIVQGSIRTSLPEEVRTFWSVKPPRMFEMAVPLNLGFMYLAPAASDYFEASASFVKSVHLGPLVFPLFFACLASRTIPGRYRMFAAVGAVITLFVCLGRFTPVYNIVTTLLPPLRIFRFPSKVMVPFSLILAVFAGIGLSTLNEGRARMMARIFAMVLMIAYIAVLWRHHDLVGFLLEPTVPQPLVEERLIRNTTAALFAIAFFLVTLSFRKPFTLFSAGMVGLVATLLATDSVNPVISRTVLRYKPEHLAFITTPEPSRLFAEDYVHFPRRVTQYLGRGRLFEALVGEGSAYPLRYILSVRSILVSPIAGEWGFEYAWDIDGRGLFQATLLQLSKLEQSVDGTPHKLRLLQMANVSYVAALHTSSFSDLQLERTIDTPLGDPLYLFRVPDFLPRAYAVSGVRVPPDPIDVAVVLDPSFRPKDEVILEGRSPVPVSGTFRADVSVVSRRSDQIVLKAHLNESGSIVLLEGFLPGWRATIDGVSVPVLRANTTFLAVSTSAGTHDVVFTYRPTTAVVGLGLSAATSLFLLISILRWRTTDQAESAPS